MSWTLHKSNAARGWLKAKAIVTSIIVTTLACLQLSAQSNLDKLQPWPLAVTISDHSSHNLFKSSVNLVLVNVTVLDRAGRAVTGLQMTDFSVLDDNAPQALRYISNEDEPISLVVIFDASASMAAKIEGERRVVKDLVKSSNPQDELSLIVVNSAPHVVFGLNDAEPDIAPAVDIIEPNGFTALWDGIYLGMQQLRSARFQRKALIVISDGGDNHSRYTEPDVKSLLEESDAQMYAVGLFDRFPHTVEEKLGPMELDELSSATGGQLFSVRDTDDLSRATAQISRELRNQYVLGFYANRATRNGKWHKLKVRLSGRLSRTKLRIYAKKGYYASVQ